MKCGRCDGEALRNSDWCLACWKTWWAAKKLFTAEAATRDENSKTRSKG